MSSTVAKWNSPPNQPVEEGHLRAELVSYKVKQGADLGAPRARINRDVRAEVQPELDVAVLVARAGGERPVHERGLELGVRSHQLAHPRDQRFLPQHNRQPRSGRGAGLRGTGHS
jgi:hypothetical protein